MVETLTKKQAMRQIGEMKRSGASLRDKSVSIEIFGLEHSKATGDSSILASLLLGMQDMKMAQWKMMRDHIIAHSPLKWNQELGKFIKKRKSDKVYLIDAAKAKPYYEFGKENKESVLDYDKLYKFDTFLEREAKKQDKEFDTIKGDKVKAMARKAIIEAALAAIDNVDKTPTLKVAA
jgi:hypothetical protein